MHQKCCAGFYQAATPSSLGPGDIVGKLSSLAGTPCTFTWDFNLHNIQGLILWPGEIPNESFLKELDKGFSK